MWGSKLTEGSCCSSAFDLCCQDIAAWSCWQLAVRDRPLLVAGVAGSRGAYFAAKDQEDSWAIVVLRPVRLHVLATADTQSHYY